MLTTKLESIGREEAMDLAVAPIMLNMGHEELAHIFRDMMTGGKSSVKFIMNDMTHEELAAVYVENSDDETLEALTGYTIDPDLDGF